ncbi:hypothetical protein RIF29_38805 [Crotalaria pallida]|uniref:Uncharacterized protein n=1 Tax=Crotalaria pallida TaxID=3830 RepID=A0AAN9HLW7_CROPI
MDGGPRTYYARRVQPAPTAVVKPKEDGEIEPEDEEEEPVAELDKDLGSCEPEFLVSTPKRLLELVSLKAVDISGVSMLVAFL